MINDGQNNNEAEILESLIKDSEDVDYIDYNALITYLTGLAENGELSINILKKACDILIEKNNLQSIINERNTYEIAFINVWKKMKNKSPDLLKDFIEEMKKNENKGSKMSEKNETGFNSRELFYVTDPKDKECMDIILENYLRYKGLNDDETIKRKMDRFYSFYNVDSTKNLLYLEDEYDFFDIETIIRLNASDLNLATLFSDYKYPFESMSNNINREFLFAVLKYISKKEEKYEIIIRLNKALTGDYYHVKAQYKLDEEKGEYVIDDNGKYLPTILERPELLEKLIQIMIKDPENHFKINGIENLENYEKIVKEKCLSILYDMDDNSNDLFNKMPNWQRKKFALFELLYGIDFEQAENLIKKYGKDIELIKARTKEEQVLIAYIKSLKNIMELDDSIIQSLIKNPEFINYIEEQQPPEISSKYIIEKKLVSMFEREYDELIKKSAPTRSYCVEFEGNEITVEVYSPIDEDGNFRYTEFAMLCRKEGAYSKWEAPENYRDYYNSQTAKNHINSEYLITQSQIIKINKREAPLVGYTRTGSLLMMAPWDIDSAISKDEFSPISVNWNKGDGIEFRVPEEFINNTRIRMNTEHIAINQGEFVFDRIEGIREDEIRKRFPNRAVYILDSRNLIRFMKTSKSKEMTETYRLACDIGERICAIDREGFAIQEEMVIEYDLSLLSGKKFNEEKWKKRIEKLTGKNCESIYWDKKEQNKLSREKLIREIIVRFENNVQGIQVSEIKKFQQTYFTDEKRKKVIDELINVIELNRETNPRQYIEDLHVIEKVIQEEKAKEQTNKGYTVYKMSNTYMELEQKINQDLVRYGLRTSLTELGNLKELEQVIDFIYRSKLYEDNEFHSTDHIVRTTLFTDILAKTEGISDRNRFILLIAAALHDCGREGKDGNEPHAVLSAKKAGKILRDDNSPFKDYNLTEDEIKMIQIAIEYHEVPESFCGKLEIESNYSNRELYDIKRGFKKDITIVGKMKAYKLEKKYLETVTQLCAILKDADALDRDRIPVLKEMTNITYLHTKSAKNIRMLAFANRLIDRTAKKLIKAMYKIEYFGDNGVLKLDELKEYKPVEKKKCLTKEEMLEVFNEMGIDLNVEKQVETVDEKNDDEINSNGYTENPIDFIRTQYYINGLNSKDVEAAFEMIKQDFERVKVAEKAGR